MTFEPTHYEIEIYNLRANVFGAFGIMASLAYPTTDILIGLKKIIKEKNDSTK